MDIINYTNRSISSRRLLTTLMLCVFSLVPALASEALDRFLRSGSVDPSSTAVMVIDLADGKVLESHNADTPLIPASIMKSLTTASLLDRVGRDYRYITVVEHDGKVRDGVLEGNVFVRGACDPSLGSEHFPESDDIIAETVTALKKLKVKKISGSIKVDDGDFAGPSIPSSWMKADLPHAYGTGSHALNFADNSSGSKSVKDPGAIFLRRLRDALSRAGIQVGENHSGGGKRSVILRHKSAPVDEIMRSCMMRSDNLYAESMLRTLSKESGGDGSTADGASRELKFWHRKGLPTDGVNVVDGSGLSRSNRMTAQFMAHLLSKMSSDPWYASFFPLAGQEGTLKKFLASTPLDSYIAMKTGSMKGIQCYAGYKLDDDYVPTHVIVIMVNNLTKPRSGMRDAASRMLLDIFGQKEIDN